ncbi:MAG TPA: glutamine-hydrolyzing carbamoyl-phosphate synthase small subunit [Polyangiales bacterium]|nr:glutamine-hydrolyzing carbamoyl-phosphate synthase small subunit [Polyangiales bacterium]
MTKQANLVLADGTRFVGESFGAEGAATGEAVFTTGMTGYEEVLTDPSYCGQIVTMTAPQIGNTGITLEDGEARRPALRGFVVRELSAVESNWRAKESLDDYLKRHGIVGISGIDTRSLTRHIRDVGAQMAAVGTEDPASLHDRAKAAPSMIGQNLTGEVTTPEAYQWTEGSGMWSEPRPEARPWHVVAMDFGIKRNILRCLIDEGCKVTVVPASATAKEVLAHDPDGIFLSNGPGDPAAVSSGIATVRELLGQRPMFGICLGHQLLSLALGGESYKLKFGHRGLNQPVKDLKTGRIEITTQNHGFCVDVDSLRGKCELTHLHLNDGTCEGIEHLETGAFSVQYHPEAAAGPHDSRYLFRRFTDAIARARS